MAILLKLKSFNMKKIILIILFCAGFKTVSAQHNSDSTAECNRFIPKQLKLQFAGNIGFLSIGAGYQYLNRKVDLDVLYGFVPKVYGGNMHILTIKNTYTPFRNLQLGNNVKLDPFTIGIPISYTFGKKYFFLAPRDQYPKRYYDYSSALRIGIFGGGRIKYDFGNDNLVKEAAFYYELGTYDLMVHNYIFNIGESRFQDLFSLGLGIQLKFGN